MQLMVEIQELRAQQQLLQQQPTIVNNTTNNLVILNFGNEDMSYLRPPAEYLERALEGMRALLDDVYFNDTKPHNHTIRINMAKKTAEVSIGDGEWKSIAIPDAACKMIDKCGNYMLAGFDSEIHKENDDVMDFSCSLRRPGEGTLACVKDDIHHKLLHRAPVTVQGVLTQNA